MIKSKIDLEVAKRLYEKYKNLHKVAEELHMTRGGLKEAIEKTMHRCYPEGTFK